MRAPHQPSGRFETAIDSTPLETVARLGSNPARVPQQLKWRCQRGSSWGPLNSSSKVYGEDPMGEGEGRLGNDPAPVAPGPGGSVLAGEVAVGPLRGATAERM